MKPLLNAKEEDKIYHTFWLATKEDGEVVGEIGFRGVNQFGRIEIGYFVNEAYRKMGYATEMVKALTEWALRKDEIKYVIAGVSEGNVASEGVLKKNGFVYFGEQNEMKVFYKS